MLEGELPGKGIDVSHRDVRRPDNPGNSQNHLPNGAAPNNQYTRAGKGAGPHDRVSPQSQRLCQCSGPTIEPVTQKVTVALGHSHVLAKGPVDIGDRRRCTDELQIFTQIVPA